MLTEHEKLMPKARGQITVTDSPSDMQMAVVSQNHTKLKPNLQTRALLGCSAVAWVVFFLNLGWTVWAIRNHPAGSDHTGLLYRGSCSRTNHLSTWLHLVINILSTALLAVSNYCMQVALAPTRDEVDLAHRKHTSLSIGVPSIRNLPKISTARGLLWLILALSSIPLHLLYNSAIFSSTGVTEYSFAITDETFLRDPREWNNNTNNPWSLDPYALEPFLGDISGWENLTTKECIKAYGKELPSGHRNVLLVVDPESAKIDDYFLDLIDIDNSSFSDPIKNRQIRGLYRSFTTGVNAFSADKHYDWACVGTFGSYKEQTFLEDRPGGIVINEVSHCDPSIPEKLSTWTIPDGNYDYNVRYCMAEPAMESCRLSYSLIILAVVLVTNALKALTMTTMDFTTRRWRENPKPVAFKPQRDHLTSVPSSTRWVLTIVSILAVLITLLALLIKGISQDKLEADTSISSLWDRGFGTINTISLIGKGIGGTSSWNNSTITMILLANTPQLVLSILYVSYNTLFTALLIGLEWSTFGQRQKPLRVSRPNRHGIQRGSYYLSLPYRFAIPLLILSALLHWLTSQSLFLAKIVGTDSHGFNLTKASVTTCGYSNIAMIFALVVGILAVVYISVVAAIPLRGTGMPIVSSNSAAISASCHARAKTVDVGFETIGWGMEEKLGTVEGQRPLSEGGGQGV